MKPKNPGAVLIGSSKRGYVVLKTRYPQPPLKLLFSPSQARSLARILDSWADYVEANFGKREGAA